MVRALEWLLCFYLMLKLIQYFVVAQPGFRNVEPSFREKLLRGEPILFIVAFTISVPIALWSSWYIPRAYQRSLEHSADCYGKLGALRRLRDVETEFDALQVLRSVRTARQIVSRSAQSLELAPEDANRLMADKLRFYTRRYSTLTQQGDRQEIRAQSAAIERCLGELAFGF